MKSVILLVAITVFAYAPVWHNGFVNYDDQQYISDNSYVTAGLTWQGIKWAFTAGYAANWHPLTWLSHMLDVQLFGLNPRAHHLTNLALHIANTLLLFGLLMQITKARGRSTFIAALFAVHPLHVESVAWAAERKDVLSTFFWILTLWGYVLYVRRPRSVTYLGMLVLFALGLMSKPMLVTLPFVLLLLDFWPLGRFTLRDFSNLPKLIIEKIPLLILTVISSIVTFFVQKSDGAVVGGETIPAVTRIANAFIAYFSYIERMLWPAGLAVLYPVSLRVEDLWWLAALALIAISVLSIWVAGRRPYIAVGWFWYVGTLVPVVGLIQVGRQATADRYTYIPLIGLFIVAAFGTTDALESFRQRSRILLAAGVLAIAACIWATHTQVQYWVNSEVLWKHTLNVTSENALAHFNLAVALGADGKVDEDMMSHFSEAVRIDPLLRLKPQYVLAQYNWANVLIGSDQPDRLDEAAARLADALQGMPEFAEAHNALGIDYLKQGKLDMAAAEFSEAIRLKPNYAGAHNNLGTTLGNQGQLARAVSECAEAVRLDPNFTDARLNLQVLLQKQRATQ